MSRLTLPALLALGAATLPIAAPPASGPQDPPPALQVQVQVQVQDLGPGLAMLVGQGGNIGLIHDEDEALLIDDQFAPLTEAILAAVATRTPATPRFVLNTHWHGDHTGGNENLARGGAIVVAHENVRQRLSTEQYLSLFDRTVPPSPEAALPVVTFRESVTIHLAGRRIDLHHRPAAHTDGDALVHIRDADLLHLGDLFFNGFYPYIDTASGGHIDGVIAAADAALALCGGSTRIIPGHGPLATPADLRAYRDMLAGLRAAVAALVADGQDKPAIIAARPSAPWDADWADGFMPPDRFVAIVADCLLAK